MDVAAIDRRFSKVLETVYATVTERAAWPAALSAMCALFNCHFGDAFARTTDFGSYRGVVHGLAEDDYQHGLLDTWVKRNVWSAVHPVRDAGVVVTTREMVEPAQLRRSEMYAEYLHPRDLHEGLRFDLWAGNGWVQDISLIRSWSAGPFGGWELEAARMLMPHLQRATAVARRLDGAEALAAAGFEAVDALGQSVFLTDAQARVLRANRAGERLLGDAGILSSERTALAGRTARTTERLRAMVAHAAWVGATAAGDGQVPPSVGSVQLRGPDGEVLNVTAIPVPASADWTGQREPTVLVMAGPPPGPPEAAVLPAGDHLAVLFDLTPAETEVALLVMSGRSPAEIAAGTRRSLNTVRTHLARLMVKTGTHRQGALMRALLQAPPENPAATGPLLT